MKFFKYFLEGVSSLYELPLANFAIYLGSYYVFHFVHSLNVLPYSLLTPAIGTIAFLVCTWGAILFTFLLDTFSSEEVKRKYKINIKLKVHSSRKFFFGILCSHIFSGANIFRNAPCGIEEPNNTDRFWLWLMVSCVLASSYAV